MDDRMRDDLLEATRLTRAGNLAEATALLRRTWGGGGPAGEPATAGRAAASNPDPRVLDLTPDSVTIDGRAAGPRLEGAPRPSPDARTAGEGEVSPSSVKRQLADALGGLMERVGRVVPGGLDGIVVPPRPARQAPADAPGRFTTASFTNDAGTRAYKLYVPTGYRPDQPVPLVVMLHGCTQSADDFAAGTGMNALAEERTFLVAYPEQAQGANQGRCWNWFEPSHQQRDAGELSLIAGITREVAREHAVDPRRVYVAGLSAGGGAAALLAAAYPDLYAAAGVHSGLPAGAARDLPSALQAMRQGATATPTAASRGTGRTVPTIVFHGDRDTTVHPTNGEQAAAQAAAGAGERLRVTSHDGRVPGGHAYTREVRTDADGRAVVERWVVHGAGHAWSGGSAAGSYTDPQGPDASREMVRFFMDHRLPGNG